MSIADSLDAFVQANGFVCGIVASKSGEVVAQSGPMESLRWTALSTSLFGDQAAIQRLYRSLDGEVLPQIYGQGDVSCVVNKLRGDMLVGLFDQNGRDDLELFDVGGSAGDALAV